MTELSLKAAWCFREWRASNFDEQHQLECLCLASLVVSILLGISAFLDLDQKGNTGSGDGGIVRVPAVAQAVVACIHVSMITLFTCYFMVAIVQKLKYKLRQRAAILRELRLERAHLAPTLLGGLLMRRGRKPAMTKEEAGGSGSTKEELKPSRKKRRRGSF